MTFMSWIVVALALLYVSIGIPPTAAAIAYAASKGKPKTSDFVCCSRNRLGARVGPGA
jgi:hypothetical protein